MRRLGTAVALVVMSLVLPARADAYIWAWLDDLSGPKFFGGILEVQVLCSYVGAANDLDTLWALKRSTLADGATYKDALANPGPKNPQRLEDAVDQVGRALEQIESAIGNLQKDPLADVTDLIVVALAWRQAAARSFALAGDPASVRALDARETAAADVDRQRVAALVFGGGAGFSICPSRPLQRDKHFLRANVGYAWDIKDENEGQRNRMFTVGLSYHWVLTRYVSFGTGGGVAIFSTRDVDRGGDRRSFRKVFLQPTILDFRPFAMVKDANLRGPWRHALYIRYSTVVFPGGFDAGSFGGNSEAYPTEFVSALGVHVDFAPAIRKWKKKW